MITKILHSKTDAVLECRKAVLTGKFIAIQAYLKKQEKAQNKQPIFTSKAARERRTDKTSS